MLINKNLNLIQASKAYSFMRTKSLNGEHIQNISPCIHNNPIEIKRERERCTKRAGKECLDGKLPKRGNSEEEHKLMFDDAVIRE